MNSKKVADTPEGLGDSLKDGSQGKEGLKQKTEISVPAILPVHDEIFPFICNNEKCGHEYDPFEFGMVANQWGYILLSNDNSSLIGLSCPKCQNTTVRKYSLTGMDLKGKIPYDLDMFGLFLTDELLDFEGNCQGQGNCFSIPDYIKPIEKYPEWFLDECLSHFDETHVEKAVVYENEHKKKIFPRIVSAASIYSRTDVLLHQFKDKTTPIVGSTFEIIVHDCLMSLARWYYFPKTSAPGKRH